ncbi:MAG TPA: aminotransferase class V-fold PLP-dependent enzyme [Terriglobales bacterium]|nr:aminotransferase class V-fold PLP-dependent enzyme [Terriglobales bacterium]
MHRLDVSDEEFRALSNQVSEFAARYLQQLPSMQTFPAEVSGGEVERLFDAELPVEGIGGKAFQSLNDIARTSRPNSPRFYGYVFGSGLPIGALGDFAASIVNPNVTAWRSSPSAVTIERTVVRWLAEAVGCRGFSGSLTGGGSSANLMALCMAREEKSPANELGSQGGIVYCSPEAHMSIAKAVRLLGLGQVAVHTIPTDARFRMRTDLLRQTILKDLREGHKPIAVVATAGTVATGSIDPIQEIASICRQHSLWLHVDGAYGALAAIAIPQKFTGLELADSVSLDPHKWLYQPAGCGCMLYRDPAAAQRAFAYSEDYVRTLSTDPIEGFAFFEESIELSRPFRALKVWLSLRYFGLRAFRESIAEDLRLAQLLAAEIESQAELELLAPVELSAVCFRCNDEGRDADELNRAVLKRVIQRGKVYISNATIRGVFALRACLVNHRSTEQDVRAITSEVLEALRDVRRDDAASK